MAKQGNQTFLGLYYKNNKKNSQPDTDLADSIFFLLNKSTDILCKVKMAVKNTNIQYELSSCSFPIIATYIPLNSLLIL